MRDRAETGVQFKSEAERDEFARYIMSFADRPFDWVMTCYPWNEPDTRLHGYHGPDEWQAETLMLLQRRLQEKQKNIRIGVSSGHGVGKTAFMAWINHWFISTHPTPQIIVTANTKTQLTTKTWRELAKWKALAFNGWMFEWSATTYRLKGREDTWFASAIPWSEHNSEAFAGTHEEHVLVAYDEASAIADVIWDVTEGAFTSHGGIWLAFGNCTRNSGRFYEQMFGRRKGRWDRVIVDARKALMRNDELIQEWKEDWGEDSDFFRVRVLGLPPKHGPLQFISTSVVDAAVARQIDDKDISPRVPKLCGVDVARQGDDETKVVFRHGRKMQERIYTYRLRDIIQLSQHISDVLAKERPDIVFVDGVGIGAGVVDYLRSIGHDNIIEVQAGTKPADTKMYYNKRIEMWDRMKQWLEVADIPDDPDLRVALTTPEYGYEVKTDKMKLERKEDMKKRGASSPDTGDALSLTFYHQVPMKSQATMETSYEPEVV